jgi:large subunit ribosomal protein L13
VSAAGTAAGIVLNAGELLMASIKQKSLQAKAGEVERNWFVIDAEGQTVGRLASRIAHVLRGKHKPQFTPSVDTGDFVIVLNAEKVVFKGNKLEGKIYHRNTTRPGGMTKVDARTLLEKNPRRIMEEAVWGMLPKGTLGRQQLLKLHVYAGASHPHAAQNPRPLTLVNDELV